MSADPGLCGYAVTDADGEQGPCDRPATGHRWYQDVEHEDMLGVACEMHRNDGGDLIAYLLAKVARVKALAAKFERWPSGPSYAVTAKAIRAALADPAPGQQDDEAVTTGCKPTHDHPTCCVHGHASLDPDGTCYVGRSKIEAGR